MEQTVANRGQHDALTILAYGALWGLAEASLGFLLHLLSRLVPGVGLAGFVMYPVAFLLMYSAFAATGNRFAPVLMSAIAAAIKLSSAALPWVTPLFVFNPSLAILSEGLVTTLFVVAFSRRQISAAGMRQTAMPAGGANGVSPRRATVAVVAAGFAGAAAAAFAWRGIFLLLVYLLPVQKGILMKGPAALASFLVVEAAVNAALIGAGLWFSARGRRDRTNAGITVAGFAGTAVSTGRVSTVTGPGRSARGLLLDLLSRPAVAGLLLLVAVGAEVLTSRL